MHSYTNCSASIPPSSLRTPPPFTQGRLWFPAAPGVQCIIDTLLHQQSSTRAPPKRTSYGVAAHHLRGAVRTKRRETSGRERFPVHEFPLGCVAAFYGMQAGRSARRWHTVPPEEMPLGYSGTPPLVRIRARHQCAGAGNQYVKAKALAERRRKLRIPRFRPRAKSSLTPLCPKEIPLGDSSFPHRTHLTAGLRRGPQLGELMGCAFLISSLFYLLYSFLLAPL